MNLKLIESALSEALDHLKHDKECSALLYKALCEVPGAMLHQKHMIKKTMGQEMVQQTQNASVKTLRDEFAMVALEGILCFENSFGDLPRFAKISYEMADAMLAERAK